MLSDFFEEEFSYFKNEGRLQIKINFVLINLALLFFSENFLFPTVNGSEQVPRVLWIPQASQSATWVQAVFAAFVSTSVMRIHLKCISDVVSNSCIW